jgi:dTDP-4-amino-4,6-dideoxygalactose transaminase
VSVPFQDLGRHVEAHRGDLESALARVLDSGRFIFGEELERFEQAFAAYCGCRFAVGVASGTDAITLALLAAGVPAGSEVITAANTCVPTIVGIERAGAVPVLADVEPDTRTLDPDAVEEAFTDRTSAIMPVHLYGLCADLERLRVLSERRGVVLIEDCAQSHGATMAGRRAGSLGLAGAFSLYPTKNLGALGDAGIVTTDDPAVDERLRLLRNYGERERFEHVLAGMNSRLDPIQAAVLSARLPRLDEENRRRQALAARYDGHLAGLPVETPSVPPGRDHVYHLYVIELERREAVRADLAARGVGTDVHYPTPVHQQPAYERLAPAGRSLAVSEALSARILSLPMFPELTDAEADSVADALAAAVVG